MEAGHRAHPIEDEQYLSQLGPVNVGGSGYYHEVGLNINNWTYSPERHTFAVALLRNPTIFHYAQSVDDPLLQSAIKESQGILALGENWDGEGSAGYSKETWSRAVNFLKLQWIEFLSEEGRPMPIPAILPDSNGSIDLWWDTDEFELLISFPASELLPASLYGHKHQQGKIEYAFDSTKADRRLVRWMAKVEGASSSQNKSPSPT